MTAEKTDDAKRDEKCNSHDVQLARLWDRQDAITEQQKSLWLKFDAFRDELRADMATYGSHMELKIEGLDSQIKRLAWKIGIITVALGAVLIGAKDVAALILKAMAGGGP